VYNTVVFMEIARPKELSSKRREGWCSWGRGVLLLTS